MTEFIFQLGFLGLFIITYLSASLIPLVSEIFVVGMLPLGYNAWGIILVATAGAYLGALTNYYIGKQGTNFVLGRYFKIEPESWERAQKLYERWGTLTLFFSWLPIIGDPLTAVAGGFRIPLTIFTFWVLLGKFFRFVVLVGISNQIIELSLFK